MLSYQVIVGELADRPAPHVMVETLCVLLGEFQPKRRADLRACPLSHVQRETFAYVTGELNSLGTRDGVASVVEFQFAGRVIVHPLATVPAVPESNLGVTQHEGHPVP